MKLAIIGSRALAFWDGTSRGSKFTLDYAKEKNNQLR